MARNLGEVEVNFNSVLDDRWGSLVNKKKQQMMSTEDVFSVRIGNYPIKILVKGLPFPGSVPLKDNSNGIVFGHISQAEVFAAHEWIRQNGK